MNWDRIQGNWKQFTGRIKEQWGELTDDQIDQIAGKRDQLSGKLQEFRKRFRQPSAERAPADVARWRALLARCPRLEMLSAQHPGEGWVRPAIAAGEAGALFTPAPTVRYSQKLEVERVAHVESVLRSGAWQRDTIYLLAPPMPAGFTVASLASSLPVGMQHLKLGPSDLVFDARCAAP